MSPVTPPPITRTLGDEALGLLRGTGRKEMSFPKVTVLCRKPDMAVVTGEAVQQAVGEIVIV
jgi:hypothetical protein